MSMPSEIKLKTKSNSLWLRFGESCFELPAELLRVYSPSAEVQGHGNPVLQYGKQHVRLQAVEPAGRYALKLVFDDGHDSGLYTWDYLRDLSAEQQRYWQEYMQALEAAGKSRDPDVQAIRLPT